MNAKIIPCKQQGKTKEEMNFTRLDKEDLPDTNSGTQTEGYFKIARSKMRKPLPSFSANLRFFSAFLKPGLIFSACRNSSSAFKNKFRH